MKIKKFYTYEELGEVIAETDKQLTDDTFEVEVQLSQLFSLALANFDFATALTKVGLTPTQIESIPIELSNDKSTSILNVYNKIKQKAMVDIAKGLVRDKKYIELLKNDTLRQLNVNSVAKKTTNVKQPKVGNFSDI